LQQQTTNAHVLGGRLGAYRKWARCTDRAEAVAASHASFNARFEREVDPNGQLPPDVRALRVAAARSAYYAELALIRHRNRKSSRRK
jgi:hypothetical protein